MEKRGSHNTPLHDTVCYSKLMQDLPPILDVDQHSGMQTFYHGCELFGASKFPQQLLQSISSNTVEFIREVDKENIQRSILLYALFLELSQAEDHVYCAPVRTKAALRLLHHLWGNVD